MRRGRTSVGCRRARSCRKCNALSEARFVSFGVRKGRGREGRHKVPSGPLFLMRGALMRASLAHAAVNSSAGCVYWSAPYRYAIEKSCESGAKRQCPIGSRSVTADWLRSSQNGTMIGCRDFGQGS